MPSRIMLVEAHPRQLSEPVYTTWNAADMASGLALSGNDLTVTKTSTSDKDWACVRATIGLRTGQWYWETTYTFTGTADISAGIAHPAEDLGEQLGQIAPASEPLSIAGPLRNGDCYYGGGLWGGTDAVSTGTVVRHWLDCDSHLYWVAVGAGSWVEIDPAMMEFIFGVANASRLYPATGLLRPVSSTASVTANFGESAFVYAVPPGVNPGVYEIEEPEPVTLYLSSHPFGTRSTDTPASQRYSARIAGDVEITRAGSCWVWGGQTRAQRGRLMLIALEGGLDDLASYLWRDAEIEILQGYTGQNRDQFTRWTRCLAEDLVFSGRDRRRAELVLADPLAVYEAPIQPEVFPDNHPIESEIGRPIPIVIGIPFNIQGARLAALTAGANAFAWQFHDGLTPLLAGIGNVYDNGISRTADAVAWPSSGPIKGIRITGTEPFGKVTIDASGVSTTTIMTIVEQAAARLPTERMEPLTIELQPGGVTGIGSWGGIYIREPLTILDVIRQAMDSVCGWASPTRDGEHLRLARVREPRGETPTLTLSKSNILGEIAVSIDTAKGLTTRLAGRRNWSPHQRSEIGDAIADPASPSYDPNRLEQLMATWMAIRTGRPADLGGQPLSDAYAQARTAEVRGTLMQLPEHVQAEANRVCTLWAPTRHFVELTAILGAVEADTLEPGDFVQLVWPRYGLDAGETFMVVSVRSAFWARRVRLVLWGSLPVTYAEG